MSKYPALVQMLIDAGYAYVDMDGNVIQHEWCRNVNQITINNSVINITNLYE